MTHPFACTLRSTRVKDPKSGMIFVTISVDEVHDFKMMLDTSTSHTTFDINALLVAKYPIGNIY